MLHSTFEVGGHHATTHGVVVLASLVVTYITMEGLAMQRLMSTLVRYFLFDLGVLRLVVARVALLHTSVVVMLHVIILHLVLVTDFLDRRELKKTW